MPLTISLAIRSREFVGASVSASCLVSTGRFSDDLFAFAERLLDRLLSTAFPTPLVASFAAVAVTSIGFFFTASQPRTVTLST